MQNRKLDVSTGAGGIVTIKRNRFDSHIDHCTECQAELCPMAQVLWRHVIQQALRTQRGQS